MAEPERIAYLPTSRPPLQSGGGGGTYDGMEPRVKALEDKFEKLDDKLNTLGRDLAVLTERVSHLPGKGFIVSATIAGLGLFAGLVLFKEHIAVLIGG